MNEFKPLITNIATFQYSIKHSKCKHHASRKVPCIINVYQTGKTTKIYGAFTNYRIPELKWYCEEYKCRKYNLLYTRNLVSHPDDFMYIITENNIKQKILCIGLSFITEDILMTINNLTIDNINGKSVAKWRKHIKINFLTRCQQALKSDNIKYDTWKLKKYIDEQVISRNYLNSIRDWLWRRNWLPFVGMFY